jgi:hypothetical protein
MRTSYRTLSLCALCGLLICAGLAVAQTGNKRSTAKKKPTPTPQPTPAPTVGAITPRRVDQPPPQAPPPNAPPVRYPLKGKILELHRDYSLATVEHEAIPGYMEAMAMKFPLKDKRLFDRLKVGDRITATLVVSQTNGDWWLEKVVKQK